MQEVQAWFHPVQMEQTKAELIRCNQITERYGLSLTEGEMQQLALRRTEALHAAGRIEFGSGILEKLARAFCDSPYLEQMEYAETLAQLQELFYLFKTECMERVSDDALVEAMRLIYNEAVHGDLTRLADADRNTIYRIVRTGSLRGTEWEREEMRWEDA